MSSFFDEASLVFIPSGYKTSKAYSVKPTSGDGDLAFSRSNDTATRVGPDGLIEKVRTNLQTYSQNFTNAVWVPDLVSITGGQTDPNGGTTAALVTATASSSVYFYTSSSTVGTYSIYAKAGNRSIFSILNGAYNSGASFNLATQTAASAGQGSLAKIEDVGGGWYRCSVYISSASIFLIALSDISGGGMNSGDTMYFAFAQRETGDIATDYIATTTAAVSVGPVANVPRLDYLNSSCPRLLLEPQRTNLALYSEQFDNAHWTKYAGATVTANTVTSPDGYTNADTLSIVSGSSQEIYATMGSKAASAITYTFSCFAKYNSAAVFQLTASDFSTSATTASFNLQTGVATFAQGATWSGTSVKMENYGNGWYRCIMTSTSPTTTGLYASLLTSTTGSVYIYGMQTEQSSYATSYIPTLGASVTRGVDLAQKTSASALIGQTEGTIFWEINVTTKIATASDDLLYLDAGSFSNSMFLYKIADGQIVASVFVGGVQQSDFTLPAASWSAGVVKMALGYANNNTAFFVNGVQVGTTDTSCSVPAMSRFQLGNTDVGTSFSRTAQVLLFPTRLSNSDLAALTA